MGNEIYKVLLVDDEKLVRFTSTAYLEKSGFQVVQAASPSEAMGFVKRIRFDAVITDVLMGDIDGFVFRDMIRQFDTRVPIVFYTSVVSGYGGWLLDRLSEDVRSYFVSKGVSREQLQSRVRKIIESHRIEHDAEKVKNDVNAGLEMASFVQHSLLPQWTGANPTYQYGVAWNPYEKVSGDLYEWIRIGTGKALVIVGDVSGHGIRSALAMAAIQAFLKRYHNIAEDNVPTVHHIARRLHRFIRDNFMDLVYMAGLIMYVDFEANVVRYLNAGIPEPKCISGTSGRLLDMNPGRLGTYPFGLMDDATYGEADVVEFSFPDDAVFIASSDGVTDISSDSEGNEFVPESVFDEVCSIAVTSDYAGGTVVQTAASIVKALDELGYVYSQDDRMLVAFSKAKPRADRLVHEVRIMPETIDSALQLLGEFSAELTGDAEISTKVQLLLGEFLINIYHHGLEVGDHRGEYGVVIVASVNGFLEVTVLDGGRNWDVMSNLAPEETQRRLEQQNRNLEVGGRGMAIMRSIADGGVSHERISGVNRTLFRIPLGGRKPE